MSKSTGWMPRTPEPELMDLPEEAEAYARADFAEVNEAFVERLCEFVGGTESVNVVDLGCGPGDIVIRLARARPGWKVVAVDASEAMLAIARQAVDDAMAGDSITLVCADACASGLPAASFDVVCSNSILHHVADPNRFWREVRRLVRPGGAVFMRDLARPRSEEEAKRLVAEYAAGESELLQAEFYRSLLSAYTLKEVRDQLAQAGLEQLKVAAVTDRHLDVFGRL